VCATAVGERQRVLRRMDPLQARSCSSAPSRSRNTRRPGCRGSRTASPRVAPVVRSRPA
jgi:hypothetical protein